MIPLADFVRTTPFFVIAHRGASGDAPENTLSAIRLAIEEGARMVEIDIQSTRDREIVVMHDEKLGRTTNGKGHVTETDLSDIRKLDAGSWFSSQYRGEHVPLLDEALDLICNNIYLNIEIKPITNDSSSVEIIKVLIQKIRDRDYGEQTIFSSFDHKALTLVKGLDASLHTVALNMPYDNRLPSDIVKSCSADAFGCSTHELSHFRSDNCKSNSIPLGVYTVNTRDALQNALSHSVLAVVSNYPGRIIKEYNLLSSNRGI